MSASRLGHSAARLVGLLVLWGMAIAPGSALAQLTRIPTPVTSPPPADTFAAPNYTLPSQSPSTFATPPPSAPATPAPYSSVAPPYTPSSPMAPNPLPAGSGASAVPSLQNPSAAPAPNWDPYGTYNPSQPSSLWPNGSPWDSPSLAGVGRVRRFLDELRLDFTYLAPRGTKQFGTDDLELSSTFAIPMFGKTETPLLITPGFAFHWWQGPAEDPTPMPGLLGHLPPRVYDAYLDTAWNPQVTPFLGAELGFRTGVYSDFRKMTTRCLRFTGHGLFVVNATKNLKIKGGIVYLDRVRIKMLPAGGLVWQMSDRTVLDILFPNPRISHKLIGYGTTEWWLYGRGEYGGGSWEVSPNKDVGEIDQVDYNDLRAALGMEFRRKDRLSGLAEIGVAFNRELVLRSTREKYSPSTTIFLRTGLVY